MLLSVTDATFSDVVLGAPLPVVVDFWAEWCVHCRPMARSLTELADEFAGRVLVTKLNVDENPETARRYRVLSLPNLTFFRSGQVTGSLSGGRPKSALRAALAVLHD